MGSNLTAALDDFAESFRRPYLWRDLAWFEVKLRFRRSVLGPLWLTLSMGAMVIGMGPLYGSIFGTDLRHYLPYLAIGIIIWGFISAVTIDSCSAFIAGTGMIRQTPLPLSSFVLRTVCRNLIGLGFNALIIVAVLIYAGLSPSWRMLNSLVGILILTIAAVGSGLLFAIFCTRYRDMQQLTASVLQILMFLTPVFWRYDQLPARAAVVEWNPAYYFLEIVRAPLLGQDVPARMLLIAAGIACALSVAALVMFARYRTRIVYWL